MIDHMRIRWRGEADQMQRQLHDRAEREKVADARDDKFAKWLAVGFMVLMLLGMTVTAGFEWGK